MFAGNFKKSKNNFHKYVRSGHILKTIIRQKYSPEVEPIIHFKSDLIHARYW